MIWKYFALDSILLFMLGKTKGKVVIYFKKTLFHIMSHWLEQLHLNGNVTVGPGESIYTRDHVPDWVSLLIWAGWWMRRTQMDNARIFMVLLLPTRICCSALCGLGALIGSMDKCQDYMTWEELLSLPNGKKIHLRLKDTSTTSGSISVEGLLCKLQTYNGQQARTVKIISGRKRFINTIYWIFPERIKEYNISLTYAGVSHSQDKKLAQVSAFFKSIIPAFDSTWIYSDHRECLIVTNRAGWTREIEGICVQAVMTSEKLETCDLSELLMTSSQDEVYHSRILLSSPGSVVAGSKTIPMAILDGADAMKSWEMVGSPNVIMLLDQTEYDENAEAILAMLLNVRDERRPPLTNGLPGNLPSGVEMTLFALEGVSS